MRVGISEARNRYEGWRYDGWQTFWTSAEIFDASGNIYLMSADSGGTHTGMQMWGWDLYDDLDESNTTPVYYSHP